MVRSQFEIVEYDDMRHRKQVMQIWKTVFGYQQERNEPGLVIDKKIRAHDHLFFVAQAKGYVIGPVMAGYDGHRGWIYSMAVLPTHRNRGVGSKLLAHSEDRLAALGCLKVNLQILEQNASVQQFYHANGYGVEPRVSMGKTLK